MEPSRSRSLPGHAMSEQRQLGLAVDVELAKDALEVNLRRLDADAEPLGGFAR